MTVDYNTKEFKDRLTAFMADWQVPVVKKPILKWNRKSTKKEIAEGLSDFSGETTHYWNPESCVFGYSLKDVADNKTYNNPLDAYDDYNIIDTCSGHIYGYYISYIDDLDVIILGQAVFDAHAVKKDSSPRKWKRHDEMIVCRDKSVYLYKRTYARSSGTSCPQVISADWVHFKKLNSYSGFGIRNMQSTRWSYSTGYQEADATGVNGDKYSVFSKELLKMFPAVCNVGSNKTVSITKSADDLATFLMYNEPVGKDGPKARRIKELTGKKLPDVAYDASFPEKTACIQKASDKLCVLRTMKKDTVTRRMVDCARIYVSDKEIISCRPTNDGRWVNMRLNSLSKDWDFRLLPFDKDVVKGTKIEYLNDLLPIVGEDKRSKLLWVMLTNPIVEQFAKAGGDNIIGHMVSRMNGYSHADEMLVPEFGVLFPKGGLLKRLGINSYQFHRALDCLNRYCSDMQNDAFRTDFYVQDCRSDLISTIKHICSGTCSRYMSEPYNISWLDNESFDKLADCYLKSKELLHGRNSFYFNHYAEIMSRICHMYGQEKMLRMVDKVLVLFEDDTSERVQANARMYYVHDEEYPQIYLDYLVMADELAEKDGTRPLPCEFDVNNHHSVVEMHNAVMEILMEILKSEQSREDERNFKDAHDRIVKWEYDDGKYRTVAPASPRDLVEEGITLHHCVGSYVNRVLSGVTNIMFLRKDDNPDESFYTIEVGPNGAVEQIHGMCNKNFEPGVDNELIDFVTDWADKKNLILTNYHKVR